MEMLITNFVIRAHVSPFEQCPKTFNPVGMHLAIHVLPYAMLNRFMIGEAIISAKVIRIDFRSWFDVFFNKRMERDLIGMFNDFCTDFLGSAVLHADNGCFPNGAASGPQFFIGMFVFLFATDIGFINFDRPSQALAIFNQSSPNAMRHMPRIALGNPKIAMYFH